MDRETAIAINDVSKRLNTIEQQLDQLFLLRQEVTNCGLADIGYIVNIQDKAISDLATIVDELKSNLDSLEGNEYG